MWNRLHKLRTEDKRSLHQNSCPTHCSIHTLVQQYWKLGINVHSRPSIELFLCTCHRSGTGRQLCVVWESNLLHTSSSKQQWQQTTTQAAANNNTSCSKQQQHQQTTTAQAAANNNNINKQQQHKLQQTTTTLVLEAVTQQHWETNSNAEGCTATATKVAL